MASSKNQSGFGFKAGIFAVLAGLAYWLFTQFGGGGETQPPPLEPGRAELACQVPDELIPANSQGQIVRNTWYALSYVEAHEQAEWVGFELTRDHLNMPWHDRPDGFQPDTDIRTESADPRDYSHSGYDRGHLCAAADLAFSEEGIASTFQMSNISPQLKEFNGGIWSKLEEQVRYWAKKKGRLYVLTGPVLTEPIIEKIGHNGVSVPSAFYKIAYDPDNGHGIGFVLPHEVSDAHFMDYACSIDEVEERTGLDFFPVLLNSRDGKWTEAALDKSQWRVRGYVPQD
ncbi:MAG: DNA/RNA non-specific endonuclease [Saprospiraceae bacterium]